MTVPPTATVTASASARPPRPTSSAGVAGQGSAPSASPSGTAARATAPPRPTRVPVGQVVTAAGVPATATTVRIEALICAGSAGGFVLDDDLGSGSLAERSAGCRSATAGEVTVRAETLAPDGLPVVISTLRSDERGLISITVPPGGGSLTVRLTAIGSERDVTTTVTLSDGQTRSLTLIVPAAEAVANPITTGTVAGEIEPLAAAGGPEVAGPSPAAASGWVALGGLLLGALGVAFPMLRRRR